MIEAPPILTIKTSRLRPTAAQIAAFQGVPTGLCGGCFDRTGGSVSSAIQEVGGGRDMRSVAAGPALTADCGAADVLAVFAALKYVQAGDIVVAAFAGHTGVCCRRGQTAWA